MLLLSAAGDRRREISLDVARRSPQPTSGWYLAASDTSLPTTAPSTVLLEAGDLDDLRRLSEELDAELALAQDEIRRLTTLVEELSEARDLLLRAQIEATAAVQLRSEREILLNEIEFLEGRNRRALDEIERLTHVIDELRASTSWRVTAPMRLVSSMVRR
jgi:hypothetical protein